MGIGSSGHFQVVLQLAVSAVEDEIHSISNLSIADLRFERNGLDPPRSIPTAIVVCLAARRLLSLRIQTLRAARMDRERDVLFSRSARQLNLIPGKED